jgi:hypothetical protein
MPRLDAFDEEFGREPVAILHGRQRRRWRFPLLIAVAMGAACVALAWPWMSADGGLRSEVQALLAPARGGAEASDQQVQRLMQQVDSLRKEIEDLTQARQEAAERIASLEAAEQDSHPSSTYWYSDLAALNYSSPFPPRQAAAAPPSTTAATARRSATARTEGRSEPRDVRRRDGSTPLSLDQQQ